MIAGFSYRQPGGCFLVRLFPVSLERTGERGVSENRGMETLVTMLEKQIRADPDQWVLTVPLWHRPYSAHLKAPTPPFARQGRG